MCEELDERRNKEKMYNEIITELENVKLEKIYLSN